jgi:hypothetical protein
MDHLLKLNDLIVHLQEVWIKGLKEQKAASGSQKQLHAKTRNVSIL